MYTCVTIMFGTVAINDVISANEPKTYGPIFSSFNREMLGMLSSVQQFSPGTKIIVWDLDWNKPDMVEKVSTRKIFYICVFGVSLDPKLWVLGRSPEI